jgi:serine/threonine-protein kinase 11
MLHILYGAERIPPLIPMVVEDIKPKPKVQLNQYVLAAKLGEGATSKVYLAIDKESGKRYAAKAICVGHNSGAASLEREINMLRSLDHPNIVKLAEVLHRRDRNIAYLVMEYAQYGSLKGKQLRESEVASVFGQILSALMYLHEKGFVHQDVKPSNILLFENGTAKLGDFGIGHSFESADLVIGSPAYQAPEVFDEPAADDDPSKEDIWSLGVAIYESAFGRLPFTGDSIYEIAATVKEKPLTIPDSASEELKDLLGHMLVVDPSLRYTAKQLSEHKFFASSGKKELSLPAIQPVMKSSQSLVSVKAHVCGTEYSFAEFKGPNSLSCSKNRGKRGF